MEIDVQNQVKNSCWCCGSLQYLNHVGSNRVFNSSYKISEIFQEVFSTLEVNEL